MSIDFFEQACQDKTDEPLFGLCDDKPNKRAYVHFEKDKIWNAEVHNPQKHPVVFTAIDNCLELKKADGKKDDSSCDGILTYLDKIIFVELKAREVPNRVWVGKGEGQIRNTLNHFINNGNDLKTYSSKKAYIANSLKPDFQSGQMPRMQKFEDDTTVTLIVQNKIELD